MKVLDKPLVDRFDSTLSPVCVAHCQPQKWAPPGASSKQHFFSNMAFGGVTWTSRNPCSLLAEDPGYLLAPSRHIPQLANCPFYSQLLILLSLYGAVRGKCLQQQDFPNLWATGSELSQWQPHDILSGWHYVIFQEARWWEDNKQEGQGSPNGGNRLQVSDIFSLSKWQEETN